MTKLRYPAQAATIPGKWSSSLTDNPHPAAVPADRKPMLGRHPLGRLGAGTGQRVNEITAVNHAGMFWARDLIPCDLYVFLSVCQRYTERCNRGHKLVGRRI